MKKAKKLMAMVLVVVLVFSMGACKKKTSNESGTNKDGEKIVKVAFATNGYPIEYLDENGKATGCDIEVMKLVDQMLDDVTFEFYEADQTAVYAGLETGTYDIAMSNAFYTDERAQKYLLPEQNIGCAVIGLIVNKSNPGIENVEDAIKASLTVAPTVAGDGLWYVLYNYNQEHPDKQIKINVTDSTSAFVETLTFVAEGRYGFGVWPKYYWSSMVEDSKGAYHNLASEVYFSECLATKTYTIFRKEDTELANKVSECLKKLHDDGTLEKLSNEWYGYNTWDYLDDDYLNK